MPWTNVTYMGEINRFFILARSGRFTVTELCEQFGISRKTGYKHLERCAALGLAGLQPRSHRPHHSPQRTDEAIEAPILAERRLHRTWGPKKLQAVLTHKQAIEQPPACSTIAEILRRHGQSVRRKRRLGAFVGGNDGLTVPIQPNLVWTVDFKGRKKGAHPNVCGAFKLKTEKRGTAHLRLLTLIKECWMAPYSSWERLHSQLRPVASGRKQRGRGS